MKAQIRRKREIRGVTGPNFAGRIGKTVLGAYRGNEWGCLEHLQQALYPALYPKKRLV
jgi:hypothetical protein